MGPILVTTDFSDRGDLAVARGAAIATALGASLHLMHVVEDDRPNEDVLADETAAEERLEATVASLDLRDVCTSVETGHSAILIPRLARQIGAELVVFGAHRKRGVSDWVGRPNLTRLLGGVECAALIAVLPPDRPYKEVLVGWDFTEAGEAAAECAARLFPSATQGLGHAIMPVPLAGISPMTTLADMTSAVHSGELEALREAAEARDASALWHHGAPAASLRLMAHSNGTDLIAVGRHKRGMLERLVVGDTAMALALEAPCDVLIVPPV